VTAADLFRERRRKLEKVRCGTASFVSFGFLFHLSVCLLVQAGTQALCLSSSPHLPTCVTACVSYFPFFRCGCAKLLLCFCSLSFFLSFFLSACLPACCFLLVRVLHIVPSLLCACLRVEALSLSLSPRPLPPFLSSCTFFAYYACFVI